MNSQSQIQSQSLAQTQVLTPLQIMTSELTELTQLELQERIERELEENAALECENRDGDDEDINENEDENESNNKNEEVYQPEFQETDDQTADYAPDDVPENLFDKNANESSSGEWIAGDSQTFFDQLNEQIGLFNVSEKQRAIIEYLIGSLSDDGLLRIPLNQIQDELDVYHNIEVSSQEMLDALHILQSFDPAGVGAQSIQECLVIQVQRLQHISENVRDKMMMLLLSHFNLLMLKRWDKIQQSMKLKDQELVVLQETIKKLNPRPGSSLSEIVDKNIDQITPDFIIETDEYGKIVLSINNSNIPDLYINEEFVQMMNDYEKRTTENLSASEKEGFFYLKKQISSADIFLKALQQREDSMLRTMKSIIALQYAYFESGDETLLKPMNLESVAKHSGLHISTVSRVCSTKWVHTNYGTFSLKSFFTTAAKLDGEDVSVKKIKAALQDIIDNEDKKQPLSDLQLTKMLKEQGYDVARRTIAKYRDMMHIPVARLRK